MNRPKMLLDTCVLRNRDFMNWLYSKRTSHNVEIPSVVYMEYRRQLISNKKDPEALDGD